ncbi:hypothetical protein AGMMS49983_05890 [Clostridia bacterium]|nr:hypothetical protein AGMMS49983_05890 [Clostridia bacterium]
MAQSEVANRIKDTENEQENTRKRAREKDSQISGINHNDQKLEAAIKELYADQGRYLRIGWKRHLKIFFPATRKLLEKYPSEAYISDTIHEKRSRQKENNAGLIPLLDEKAALDHRLKEIAENKRALENNKKSLTEDRLECKKAIPSIKFLIAFAQDIKSDNPYLDPPYKIKNTEDLYHLQHKLFGCALKLFEQYILKNRTAIVDNLRKILTENKNDRGVYNNWCQSLFNLYPVTWETRNFPYPHIAGNQEKEASKKSWFPRMERAI